MKQHDVELTLAVFRDAIGEAKWPIVCNQVASLMGKLNVAVTSKPWQCSDRGILTTSDGYKAYLPNNDWRGILYKFATQLQRRLDAMSSKEHTVTLQCELPALCRDAIAKIEVPKVIVPELATP